MARNASFNRRHFEEIAEVIRNLEVDGETRVYVALRFSEHLKGSNSGFDAETFMHRALGEQDS